jgi:hypothetical protein
MEQPDCATFSMSSEVRRNTFALPAFSKVTQKLWIRLPRLNAFKSTVPDTLAKRTLQTNHVDGEIRLWHMSPKPVSGQCDMRMLFGALCPVQK